MNNIKTNKLLPLEVNNLSYSKNNKALLKNINCNVSNAGVTVIMGPNGAGKSLFLRCLHGISNFSKGQVRYDDVPLNKSIRLNQSMVFQNPIMLRRSVYNNLVFVAKQRKKYNKLKILNILKKVDLLKLQNQSAYFLSGGEKQRLALARALITEPKLLFLDEATSNLDPYSIQVIENIIKDINKNGTKVILITHDIHQAMRIADDVLFFYKGILCEHKNANKFFNKPSSDQAKLFLKGKILL